MKKLILLFGNLILKILAKLTLLRHKPYVIGITGSVGKTSAKSAIFTVLDKAGNKRVHMAGGNLNNETGLPLAILGNYEKSAGLLEGMFIGVGVIIKAVLNLISPWSGKSYPEVLILEYGADKPGDINKLLKIARPDVSVITAVGNMPVHVEFYDGPEEVAKEKADLVKGIKKGGAVVLNGDDPMVSEMEEGSDSEIIKFGFSEGLDVKVSSFKNHSEPDRPKGLSFKLETKDHSVPVKIDGVFGKSQAYAAVIAASVGLTEGINLVKIAEALAFYDGEKGRTRLIPGIKNSLILDDTYNSSPASATAALEILEDIEAPRKIAVLGDMLELGKYTIEAHRKLGKQVSGIVEILITVGPKSAFIVEGAKENGFPDEDIKSFDTSNEAKGAVQDIIEEGDLVLVKASQGIRTEKIVEEIMREPEKAKELLVRQYGKWLK